MARKKGTELGCSIPDKWRGSPRPGQHPRERGVSERGAAAACSPCAKGKRHPILAITQHLRKQTKLNQGEERAALSASPERRAPLDSKHWVTSNSCIRSHIFALTPRALAVAETRAWRASLPPPPFRGQEPAGYTATAPAVLLPGQQCFHPVQNQPLIPAVISSKGPFTGLRARRLREVTRDATAHVPVPSITTPDPPQLSRGPSSYSLPSLHHASPPTSWSFLSCPPSITPLLPTHGPSFLALLPSCLSSYLMVLPFLPCFHHASPPISWSFPSCPPSITPLLPPHGLSLPALLPSHLSSHLMVLPFLPSFHHASPPTSWSLLSCPPSITPTPSRHCRGHVSHPRCLSRDAKPFFTSAEL